MMKMKMGSSITPILVLILLVGLSTLVKDSQAADCGKSTDLLVCLSAAKADVQPSAACCQQLNTYTQGGTAAGEACLCQAASDPQFSGSGAKIQYAVKIPQKCNLKYKAGYVCNGIVIPGGH